MVQLEDDGNRRTAHPGNDDRKSDKEPQNARLGDFSAVFIGQIGLIFRRFCLIYPHFFALNTRLGSSFFLFKPFLPAIGRVRELNDILRLMILFLLHNDLLT